MYKLPPIELETFNKRLKDKYGDTSDKQNFRVVWSEDEFEVRLTGYTDEGLQLLVPEYRELPKYRQYIQDKYILERLTVVPHLNSKEITEALSYEPIWVFERGDGSQILPTWHAISFIVENLLHAMEHPFQGVKYKDPYADPVEREESKRQRINQLEKDLFGNETPVGDALAHGTGIVVPGGNVNG